MSYHITAKDIYQYLLMTKSEALHLNPIKDTGLEENIQISVEAS
jgi:hypothetical protein